MSILQNQSCADSSRILTGRTTDMNVMDQPSLYDLLARVDHSLDRPSRGTEPLNMPSPAPLLSFANRAKIDRQKICDMIDEALHELDFDE